MVLKKSKKEAKTQFIDASNEYVKVTNNNKLTDENIQNVLKCYTDKKDIDYVSRIVKNSEIADNDYNLSVNTYVEKEDKREIIDIKVLNAQIKEIVEKEDKLRKEIDKIIKELDG